MNNGTTIIIYLEAEYRGGHYGVGTYEIVL